MANSNKRLLNLGLSALSGLKENRESPRLEGGLDYLYEHLNRFYNFQGLHGFKEKFNPRWESRYLTVLKQFLSPNKAQTRFISYKYVTIMVEPFDKTIRHGCTK